MTFSVAALWLLGAASADSPPVEISADSVVIERSACAAEGDVSAQWAGWRLWADRWTIHSDGRFDGTGARITRCDCSRPPWSISARELEGELEGSAVLKGAAIELCGRRVLPIPWARVPLGPRRPGLRLPRVGMGEDGLVVAQPVSLPLGEAADLTLAPEWRSAGGARLLGDGRSGEGDAATTVSGAIGQEAWGGPLRGMAAARGARATGPLRLGLDGAWLSDPRYLSDYGSDFLSRSAPWTETLAVAGVGPVRLESNTFGTTAADVQGLAQRPVAGVLSLPDVAVGGLAVSAAARVDMVDSALTRDRDLAERLSAAMGIRRGLRLGPVQLEARGEGRSTRWAGGRPWHEARLQTIALVDLWGDVGPLRHLASVGLAGSASGHEGRPDARLPEDALAPMWSVGPVLRSRWLSAAGVPIALEAAAPVTEEGLVPEGASRLQLGDWGARLSGSPVVQSARAWWDTERWLLSAGAAATPDLLQASGEAAWTLPPPASAWRPGWRALHDIAGGQVLSQGPTLGFDSPCDCLRIESSATWSADRDVPEFWVRLDLGGR